MPGLITLGTDIHTSHSLHRMLTHRGAMAFALAVDASESFGRNGEVMKVGRFKEESVCVRNPDMSCNKRLASLKISQVGLTLATVVKRVKMSPLQD